MLRISTVVDTLAGLSGAAFGSAKNFYCCRLPTDNKWIPPLEVLRISTVVDVKTTGCCSLFGSAKNFYCCRSAFRSSSAMPLEVLRISTVVDKEPMDSGELLWKC